MSYIRWAFPMQYVEGNSKDYVFPTCYIDKGGRKIRYIEDYGSITKEGIVEILFRRWETDDKELKEHLLKRLSDILGVKLRGKKLDGEDYDKEMDKIINKE